MSHESPLILTVDFGTQSVRTCLFDKDGNLLANEKEEYVCYAGMWWVPENNLAYMEPLCTIPEYRGRGLAAAALSRHYHRLKPLGAKYMTGGNNDFYKKIGYHEGTNWVIYSRR